MSTKKKKGQGKKAQPGAQAPMLRAATPEEVKKAREDLMALVTAASAPDPFMERVFAVLTSVLEPVRQQARAITLEKLTSALRNVEESESAETKWLAPRLRYEIEELTAPVPAKSKSVEPAPTEAQDLE